ncbi:MAG: SirB2 family protein [Lysobacterales bacterium]
MDYSLLKFTHMSLALISINGIILRWSWRMGQSTLAFTRASRVIPHVVDTLLLGTAMLMMVVLGHIPVSAGWLTAKVGGLRLYIFLGTLAMHSAPVAKRSVPAFLAAVLVFAWIVSVAWTKSPLGFLLWLRP